MESDHQKTKALQVGHDTSDMTPNANKFIHKKKLQGVAFLHVLNVGICRKQVLSCMSKAAAAIWV